MLAKPDHARLHMKGRKLNTSTKQKIAKQSAGENNWNHKLTDAQVRSIKRLLDMGVKGTRIAADNGVGKKCINDIKLGKRWKHIV